MGVSFNASGAAPKDRFNRDVYAHKTRPGDGFMDLSQGLVTDTFRGAGLDTLIKSGANGDGTVMIADNSGKVDLTK